MNTRYTRWTSPILGSEAERIYNNVYGEKGEIFANILETAPYEIAVLSRLLVYLQNKKKEDQ